jgi:DNA-binding LacI/PurR family transcriptional regulator
VILIGVPEDPHGLHCVDLDFGLAARLAVDELAATGHDRLVQIGHPAEIIERDLNYVRRFYDAARVAAERHGLPLEVIAPVEWGRAAAHDAAERLTALRADATRLGVIIPASNTVQPVLHALNSRGVVPGRDLSVIGLLTDAAAAESEMPVTNVSLEPRDVSRRAMETLFRLLDHPIDAPPRIDLIAPRLTRRNTVMPAP